MRMLKTIALLAVCLWPALGYALKMTDVRVGQNGHETRVVFELDGAAKPKTFTLEKPNRLVLDFPSLNIKPKLSKTNLPEGGLITTLRSGQYNTSTVRMVLELTGPVKYNVFTIPAGKGEGYRVVVDLNPPIHKAKQPAQAQKETTPPKKREVEKAPPPIVVIIDPGHGGIDPGALGEHNTREKDVVLAVAKLVRQELENTPGVKVKMTRTGDQFIRLQDRVAFARKQHGDVFVSIHADSHHVSSVRGGSVYVLSEQSSDKEAARLADVANRGDEVAGMMLKEEPAEVRDILIDLAQRETLNQSALLARGVIDELSRITYLRSHDIKFAGFRVLKAPDIPSILVELAYLSNPTEERLLRTRAHQLKVAKALSEGILKYMKGRQAAMLTQSVQTR